MGRLAAAVAILAALGAAAPAVSQPTPPVAPPAQPAARAPIRAFDSPTLERLGLEIYRQDAAAWVATDALRAQIPDLKAAHAIGWIVVPHGQDERVRFLRDTGSGPEIGWDIDVDDQRHAVVSDPTQRQLAPDELAQFTARQTAAREIPGVCRPGYNSVVARDPEGDGWLVWWLAPMPAVGIYPIGGHYRFTVSADGKTVQRRDTLFATCITMDAKAASAQAPAGSKTAAYAVSNVVSPLPLETHVFIQLQSGVPLMVLAQGRVFGIEGGKIKDYGAASDLKAAAAQAPGVPPPAAQPPPKP